ncbi:hypothetical protein BH09MYX1_BH09MYX1_36370 [soil metagenome]
MDRRHLLKAAASVAVAGCAADAARPAAPPTAPAMTETEVDDALAELDATLGRMRAGTPNADVLGAPVTDSLQLRRGHALVMKTFASMHIAATFRELPADVQSRPDVQERMWRAMPDMDDAMLSLTDVMQKLTPTERKRLQKRFADEPDLGMKVVEKLDDQAKRVGVGIKRRAQMRAAAVHATWRMTNQSVGVLLDECIDKTQRVIERNGRDAEVQRAAAAKLTELGLFGPTHGDGPAHLTLATGIGGSGHHSGTSTLLVGGVLLGVGGVLAGVGGLMIATVGGIGGAFLITAGALLGIAAIIVLIVGAVMAATEKRATSEDE